MHPRHTSSTKATSFISPSRHCPLSPASTSTPRQSNLSTPRKTSFATSSSWTLTTPITYSPTAVSKSQSIETWILRDLLACRSYRWRAQWLSLSIRSILLMKSMSGRRRMGSRISQRKRWRRVVIREKRKRVKFKMKGYKMYKMMRMKTQNH